MFRLRLFICACLLCLTFAPLVAQIRLVGTHTTTGNVTVYRWNANTGSVIDSVPTSATGYVLGASVFDAPGAKYYFREPNGLQRNAFSPSVADLIPVQYDLSNAEIDMQNSKIFAVHSSPVLDSSGTVIGSSLGFMEYKLADSSETLLLTLGDAYGYVADGSAYDSNHGIYYFLGTDTLNQTCLYSITTANGNYSYSKIVLNAQGFAVATMDYDNDNDILYGLGHLTGTPGGPYNLQIQMINTTTGAFTLEADLTQLIGLQIGSNTYDQFANTMVFRAQDTVMHLWGYDTQAHALMMLQEPMSNIGEVEADNSDYAQVKYGATGIRDSQSLVESVLAFPNPAQDRVTIQLPQSKGGARVTILDLQGRAVMQEQMNASAAMTLNVEGLPDGTYFIRAWIDGQSLNSKIVVCHGLK